MKATAAQFWTAVSDLSPETIGLVVTLGFVLGVFPVFGCPTLLCAVAALILRLNLPAVQLVNQVSSPLQIALFFPLRRIGAHILGTQGGWGFAAVARDAIVGWLCVCLPLGLVLYLFLVLMLRRYGSGCFNGLGSSA